MKKPITKKQVRQELESQLQDFLESGGAINDIPRGVSGREPGSAPIKPSSEFFQQQSDKRTYVPEVVNALEERKKKPAPEKKPTPKKRRKVMIYDDFGDPLRWVWKED